MTSPHLAQNENKKDSSAARNRLIFAGGVILLGLALVLLLFGGNLFGDQTAEQPAAFPQVPAEEGSASLSEAQGGPITVGHQAYSFALADLDGRPVTLSDFGGQPVLINFWATWCPPCRLEMPEFQRAFEAHQDDGLVILAVNEYEDADTVRRFFSEEMGFTYTALLDSEGSVGKAYGATALPASVFVAPDGTVTAVHRGLLTAAQLEGYLVDILP